MNFSQEIKLNLNKQKLESKIFDLNKSFAEKLNKIPSNKTLSSGDKKNLKTCFEEIDNTFNEYKNTITDLMNELKNLAKKSNETSKKSYSEAIRSQTQQQNQKQFKSKEVVIIYPTEDMTSEDLKTKIKSKLNIKTIGNIGINSIKKIKNNGVVIECNDKNQCKILEQNINENLSDVCKASLPTKKNPRLIVYNIYDDKDSDKTKEQQMEEIKESIVAQNEAINEYMKTTNSEVLKTKFFIKSKSENFKHLVIEVSPELRKIINNLQKLNINWSRNSVKDFISITRCFKCLGFGHTKANCDSKTEHCSTCASTHSHQTCKAQQSGINCVNCLKYNEKIKNSNIKQLDTKHNALYSECPSLQRIKNLIISKINYD